jgi:hypothetical protein
MIVKDLTERDPRTYAIIGAAMEVHKQLGCGFLEPAYQEALAVELALRNIPFRREVRLPLHYKRPTAGNALLRRLHLFSGGRRRVEGTGSPGRNRRGTTHQLP